MPSITWWVILLFVWVSSSCTQSLAQAGVSASHKSCGPKRPGRLCVCWPRLTAGHWFLYTPNRSIPEKLAIASLSLLLVSSVPIISFLGGSLYLLSFSGGHDFGKHPSEQQYLWCYISHTNIDFIFVSVSITSNSNRLITCFTIFSGEVLHLHLIAISSGFQDISGQNKTHQQICGICQAANMPWCCHLCLLLYFFVQNCGPLAHLFFAGREFWACKVWWPWGKADPTAAAGDLRQKSKSQDWVAALQSGHNQCGNS